MYYSVNTIVRKTRLTMASSFRKPLRKNSLLRIIYRHIDRWGNYRQKTKFVILAKYRVGSNFLVSLLSGHPHIELSSELFNVRLLSNNINRVTHPKSFLKDFFSSANEGCFAKGFKLMYNHLSCKEFDKANWPPYTPKRIEKNIEIVNQRIQHPLGEIQRRFDAALAYLINQKTFKVIHLKRRNMLDTLISKKRAFSEDNWVNKPYSKNPIQLSISECEAFFSKTIEQQEYYKRLFSRCPIYDLYYEDLVDNVEETLSRIQDFLQVPKQSSLSSSMKKQGKRNRRSQVENYISLKKHFAGSKWSKFFSES